MADRLRPRDAKDVEAAVQWALGEGKALELIGHGSKRAIGRPVQTDLSLDLSGLSGVTLYEPEELVLSAKAGTPLAEVEARLLEETLRATKGNKTLTAKLLGIDPTTVLRKLKRQEEASDGSSNES